MAKLELPQGAVKSGTSSHMKKKSSADHLKEFIPKSWACLKNYTFSSFKKDLGAGITVGIVALPLAMAFAISSGVGPEKGLYTAIVAGFIISLFGGSRVQIGGPTGAFVVIVYEIIQRQGYEGLAFATILAAFLLIIMGICRLGTLIKYIPYPLITGFTSGIAVIIFSSQIKDFFGLQMNAPPAAFIEKWSAYFNAFPSFDPLTLGVSVSTFIIILLIRKFFPDHSLGYRGYCDCNNRDISFGSSYRNNLFPVWRASKHFAHTNYASPFL